MEKLIEEYNPKYCQSLESAYGFGMMSEGGAEAVELMFEGLPIHGKNALDIGSGLGGVAYHLAQAHDMDVTGLEINPWMIQESIKKAPKEIQDKLHFILNTDNDHLPFADESFDVVYSKGVLTHVEHKQGLFKECYRILKPQGLLVINDWLSPEHGKWGENITKSLIEMEGLTLFAESIDGYLKLLEHAGFEDIKTQDHSKLYVSYNKKIVERLKSAQTAKAFIESYGKNAHQEAIEGYELIAKAMSSGEGLVIQFTTNK